MEIYNERKKTWRPLNKKCQPAKRPPPGSQTSNYKYGNRFTAAAQEIVQIIQRPTLAFNMFHTISMNFHAFVEDNDFATAKPEK